MAPPDHESAPSSSTFDPRAWKELVHPLNNIISILLSLSVPNDETATDKESEIPKEGYSSLCGQEQTMVADGLEKLKKQLDVAIQSTGVFRAASVAEAGERKTHVDVPEQQDNGTTATFSAASSAAGSGSNGVPFTEKAKDSVGLETDNLNETVWRQRASMLLDFLCYAQEEKKELRDKNASLRERIEDEKETVRNLKKELATERERAKKLEEEIAKLKKKETEHGDKTDARKTQLESMAKPGVNVWSERRHVSRAAKK
ncbi:hypothetical protein BJ508DRAFT_376761 [Ascobolus immersus RN42]|uniref:Uncharacterized protein n=1 Tax=Ascobolus immersus RN42 TaxID=1160509 RepID=A0A3N4I4M0_ASCIM|nr:hypothetical protein BJ508DRAFT_376761 [Ascobolus immersus RN42]